MAYALTNPPSLISHAVAANGQIFNYKSADPAATVCATGYFTNAQALGFRVGDVVEIVDTAQGILSTARVAYVNATNVAQTFNNATVQPGAADLGDPTIVGAGTNAA